MAQDANDWAISRSRFWGTPLPIWASEDGQEVVVVSSRAQLEQLTGARVSAPQPVLPLTPNAGCKCARGLRRTCSMSLQGAGAVCVLDDMDG